ncbi:dihydrofolate reductase [Ornithobacterium rhinotracheale]|uniref:dihydrofolate reductase n=1 Tax=Ornithobacterium rhinotracheale TaxID=28251 RepID=UPI00129C8EE2|nr:dihydrofolate reductase [Ornithobacterium rhinotracheale]MRI63006.1 dihydrofolate reductase [Ornithobacterium rhinotracheale]
MKPQFKLISVVAVAENNVIGKDGGLIWHIPEDLKHFKKLTMGHPMIMGRKTFESFPKPLPNRVHIVLSRDPKPNTEQVIWVNGLDEAIATAKRLDTEKAYVIGGGNIYRQTMDFIDEIEITRIHKTYEGDTHFPTIDTTQFELNNTKDLTTEKGIKLTFETYKKIK